MERRDFLKMTGTGLISLPVTPYAERILISDPIPVIMLDPEPLFELSPWLYMQFMEPLGVTDSSVEAAWDHGHDCWREDVIKVTTELAPGMIRWGGVFSAYYCWREGTGPREKRKPMLNIQWGGMESNQIGTAEFVDFCRRVGADPMMCVNFESDGNPGWAENQKGENRCGDANEAAEWVDYCNNPSNRERLSHGFQDPLTIPVWQVGNETSYHANCFDNQTAAQKTLEFAKAMKKKDPSISIIGWGDSGWAGTMLDIAGEYIDYIAFHHGFAPGMDTEKPPSREEFLNYPLNFNNYRKDPALTWDLLMNAHHQQNERISEMREEVSTSHVPLAMTECHYGFKGRNRGEVLSTWAAGVSYARLLNVHERNGDILKIATLADFCGTRWQNVALMIQVPRIQPYLMPVAKIMCLYRKHTGEHLLSLSGMHPDLDITASRTGEKVFLHVVNINRVKPAHARIVIRDMEIVSGKAFELSTDPEFELTGNIIDPLIPKERILQTDKPVFFPPASVTAIELKIKQHTS